MNGVEDKVKPYRGFFLTVWAGAFLVLSSGLMAIGVAPDALTGEAIVIEASTEDEALPVFAEIRETAIMEDGLPGDAPRRVIIEAVDIDTSIQNPESRDIAFLDAELQKGAVHYPGSGNLSDTSNMFLFGHSSRLPVVVNQAYKAFNNINKLRRGDIIRVQSAEREYHYRVSTVDEVAADRAWVSFATNTKKLTLSTCNNFGTKQDRFVVEADFVGSFPLADGIDNG